MVMREVFNNPGITRAEIWDNLKGETPREDSAEADLFKLLVDDLSMGRVIRQRRETDGDGNFLRNNTRGQKVRGATPRTMKSAFEDGKPYVLTALGKQFVQYVMADTLPQLDS
jgi:hypothetical protein